MRVGLIIYGSLANRSGGYLYDRMLVEALRAAGDEVQVFSLTERRYYGLHLLDNLHRGFADALHRAGLDVLLQDELNHPSLVLLNRSLRRRLRCPIVAIVHHLRSSERRAAWQNALYASIERSYLRTVDAFIFNSRTTRHTVEALAGEGRPGVVAFPGSSRFAPELTRQDVEARAQRAGPLRLLFVGNVIPRKGLHRLVEALTTLQTTDWHLDVVGSTEVAPDYVHRIRRQIGAAGLGGRIVLHGALGDAALRRLFSESHLLAVPSSYEGFGIVYLEGMSSGLPALAGAAGAAHEIITHEMNGFLIDPDDTSVIASIIKQTAENRERLAEMGAAALVRIRHHPSWDESMSRIRGFLLSLLEEHA